MWLVGLMVLTLTACAEDQFLDSGKSLPTSVQPESAAPSPSDSPSPLPQAEAETNTDSDIQDESNLESVEPPSNITGTFLHCRVLSVVENQSELGCRYDDQNGKRLAPSQLADSIVFAFEAPNESGLTVTRLPTVADPVHDMVLAYSSNSAAKTARALNDTLIKTTVTNPKSSDLALTTQVKASDILAPADNSANFTLVDKGGKQVVKDLLQNVYFVRMDGASLNWDDSLTACRNLTTADWSDWNLVGFPKLPRLLSHGTTGDAAVAAALKLNPANDIWMDAYSNPSGPNSYFSNSAATDFTVVQEKDRSDTPSAPICERAE